MDPEDRSEIAFFDVETTVPKRGERFAILEFGSILVCPKKLTELRSYTTLVQPADLSLISSLSVRCNGIKRDDVVVAPLFSDIADTVYDILHGRIWAGHNILRFDCARIREAFAEIGRQPPEPKGAIDSLALLTRKFGRRAGDMKMATLATYFGLGKQTHRSLDDVRMNLEVLKYCATVLFLESSLPDGLVDNSVSPETTSSRRHLRASSSREGNTVTSSLRLPSIGENSVAQPDPFNMSLLRNEVASGNNFQSDTLMEEEEEQNQPSDSVVSENTSDHEGFLAPDTISLQNIKAILVPFYHGGQVMKLKLLHGDSSLQNLYCSCLKIRFGINGKYLDNAGRRKLNFVVDLYPSLCSVLQACDSKAQRLSVDSGSGSDWNQVVNPMKGFVNYPNSRIHIPTEIDGDVARYATEIHQRESSGATQKLTFSNPSGEELESLLKPGSVVDAFLSLEPYDYQQKAGIRLVAKKLRTREQEQWLPDQRVLRFPPSEVLSQQKMGKEDRFMTQKRVSTASGVLPTTMASGGGGGRKQPPRGRQIKKTFNNLKMTILCGFVTVLVLRGTIGVNFGTSDADAVNQNLIEETNRLLAEIRSDSDPTDPNEPPDSDLDLNMTYTLGPKITNWDQQRETWLNQNPDFPNFVNGKARVLLLTGSPPKPCDNPIGDHYLLKSAKNKIDYCRIHGIEIVYNMAHLDKELAGYWAKLPMLRRLMLSHPEIEWIWWMDSDALFTDMVFEIPLSKYENHNLVIHGYPDLLFEQKSWIALNTGSFLFRNCQWSLDLLDAWAPMGPKGPIREEAGKILTAYLKGRPAFEADDQSALIYLLLSEKDKWMGKVFVENQYYLHGFWEGLVDRYEEMMEKHHPGLGDERWPFVTHFVGCKPCGSYADYAVERCLKSMERAYNFADNQVLKLYGFSHRGLLSPKIKRIRNETTFPLKFVDRFDIRRTTPLKIEARS